MWKATKIIIALLIIAFCAGFLPTIIDTVDETVVYTEEQGLALHPTFISNVAGFLQTAKNYTWHILIVYACFIGVMIFMEGQNPDRTILWLLTLLLVPVFGVAIYLFVGPDLDNYKRRKKFRPPPTPLDKTPFTRDRRFLAGRSLHTVSGADLLTRNRIDMLINGDATFDSIKKELRAAKHYIHMEYFIINDDEIGREIRDLLVEAAKRGVSTRLMYDAIGSWKLGRKFIETLTDAGVECHSYMPMAFPMFRRQMNFRNHRKIIVIDDRVAFTGGLNIGDEYLGKGRLGFWRDTHVRLEGEAVDALHGIFLHDWCTRTGEDPDVICEQFSCSACDTGEESRFSELPTLPMQVVASGVNNPWHTIATGYFSMISRAKERVWITSPYLVPGQPILTALSVAALSGVDVRILIPSTKDHFLVFWASRCNVEPLLRAGARVFMYEKGFVHTKSLLADEDICSVGTCNLDVRSLEINFENQLFIYDKKLNGEFAKQFEEDIKDACEINLEQWEKRPLRHRILESFGRLYSAQI